jgi:hypothetical protein
MKNTGRQIMKMIDHLSEEIKWRYPNLYQSLSENRVHRILEDLFESPEDHNMERMSLRVSHYVNRKRIS